MFLGSHNTCNMHETRQIGIEIHEEVGTTLRKGCSVDKGPLGTIDTFEGSMCGITHTWGQSCMTCMTIMGHKNVMIQIEGVVENE